ncbi:MAG: hypothetical protein ABSG17_18475 [Spirochaetia bacterium]|jgi:hypothetical protein
MLALIVVLSLLTQGCAAETLRMGLMVASDLQPLLPDTGPVQAQILSAFNGRYGRLVTAVADSGTPPLTDGGNARVSLQRADKDISVLTEIARGSLHRSLTSTVPLASPASLVPTIAGDLAYLWFSLGSFSALALGPPPRLSATLQTDTLTWITGWLPEDLEPVGIAGTDNGIVVCFPHRWMSLGPSFRLGLATVRDLLEESALPEALQLSGIVAGKRGELYLLSEQSSLIARVDPAGGARQQIDAPSLTGLGGSALTGGGLAVLSDDNGEAAITVYRAFRGSRLPVHAAYASAISTDGEGNVWVWDAEQRRVRVLSPFGGEISSIKPLFDGSIMQLPQQLAALPDGGFLLGGSGEVWKFDRAGIPVFRLRQSGGRPPERLPSSFMLALVGGTSSFVLLDTQERRLLQFDDAGPQDPGSLAALVARLDERKATDLREVSRSAQEEGMSLLALQFAAILSRAEGPSEEQESALASITREKALLYGSLADSFIQDLQYDRAEKAFQKAAESARAFLARNPQDREAGPSLHVLEARLKSAHETLVNGNAVDLTVVSLAAERTSLRLSIKVRNAGSAPMNDVLLSFTVPGLAGSPGSAAVGLLAPGASAQAGIRLLLNPAAAESDNISASISGKALVVWKQAGTRVTAALSASVPWPHAARDRSATDLADSLVLAATAHPLVPVLGLPSGTDNGDPLGALASALDWMGDLRARAASESGGNGSLAPRLSLLFQTGPEAALRAFSPDPLDWVVLSTSLALHLGMPAGIAAWEDSAVTLIQTDIPLSRGLAIMPFLVPYKKTLEKLSRDGRLSLPVSGRLSIPAPAASGAPAGPETIGAAARALADGLRECQRRGAASAAVRWIDPADVGPPDPSAAALPVELPSVPSPTSRDRLRIEILGALKE